MLHFPWGLAQDWSSLTFQKHDLHVVQNILNITLKLKIGRGIDLNVTNVAFLNTNTNYSFLKDFLANFTKGSLHWEGGSDPSVTNVALFFL